MFGDHYCLLIICLCTVVMPHPVLSTNGGHPPQILQHPNAEVAYNKDKDSVQLPCEARGFPKPQFFWEKDGVRLELNDNVRLKAGSGSLVIAELSPSLHDGIYQCFAYNEFGVAVTTKAMLKAAEQHPFPTVPEARIHRPEVGSPLTLPCNPPQSYPSGMVYWAESSPGARLQPIVNTERVSLDYTGNLHFSYIEPNDYRNNRTYLCIVDNEVLRGLVAGNDQKIIPRQGSLTYRAPALLWSSSSKEIAIKEETKRMKCIFSGYPTPVVTWTRLGAPLPDRVENSSFGQEIVINHVSHEDAGRYRCSAKNSNSSQSINKDIEVVVESAPYWRQGRSPQDVTAAEDEDVEFECIADGIPSPTVFWSFNGRPYNESMSNSRLIVSSNKVKFLSVTRHDNQVLQCNASNVHGYTMANAFLRVREPIDVPCIVTVELGEDSVVVTWRPSCDNPAKNPGSKFVVEYRTKDMTEWNTSSVEEHYDWVNLTGLYPGKTYEVVVVAMNPAGEKKRSESRIFDLCSQQAFEYGDVLCGYASSTISPWLSSTWICNCIFLWCLRFTFINTVQYVFQDL